MNVSRVSRLGLLWGTAIWLAPLVGARAGEPAPLVTAKVTRGPLVVTVAATGTLEPEEIVDVGAQVIGRIVRLGDDPHAKGKPIDHGSVVEQGTLLAQIDDALYVAQVERAQADCAHAKAELALSKAKLELAEATWQRIQDQMKAKSVSAAARDQARFDHQAAVTSLAVAEATLARSRAALREAEICLDGTRIRAPVAGVIIDRRVNLGQTVVANLNAPSLFLIAKDLKRMQVWASVHEADVARIRAGQEVRFTVDAYPNELFRGKVDKVRLNATMTQNVVTYTVVVTTDNPDGKLLPYLTANVQFEVERRKDVLLVPNAALRWRPQPEWIAPGARAETPRGGKTQSRVWVRDDKFVRPVAVEIGLSDGRVTEITGGDLKEGEEVILGGILTGNETGRGPKDTLQRVLASMGTNMLIIFSGQSAGVSFGAGTTGTLTAQDADAIARQCPAVCAAAPVVRGRGKVTYGDRNWATSQVLGSAPAFLTVRDWEELSEGDVFTDADVRNAAKVCLIGATIKRELFAGESPLGKEVRIQNVVFRVIGVLARKGANIMGMDQDDIVLAPWTTIKYRLSGGGPGNVATVDAIYAKVAAEDKIPQASEQITELLRQRHHLRTDQDADFNIRDMTELTKALLPSRRP